MINTKTIKSWPFGVNVAGFFHSEKGVGVAARASYNVFKKTDIPHCAINYDDPFSQNIDHSITNFSTETKYSINLININADGMDTFATCVGDNFYFDRYNIGYWNWELDHFLDEFLSGFRILDEVWAPSKFTHQSISSRSPVPVFHIPYAVEIPKLPVHMNRSYFGLPENKMIFMFAFDFQSLLERKNPKAVVKAFLQAFGHQEDVLLVLKTVHGQVKPNDYLSLKKLCNNARNILVIDKILSREEMYALTNCCDVFVSLHRAEGFGLNIFEAMALGKPVIATNYSANTDYMNEENSYPISYQLIEIDRDHGPYKKGQKWADANINHAAKAMRDIYENPEKAQIKAQKAKEDIKTYLSYEAVSKIVEERLRKVSVTSNHDKKIKILLSDFNLSSYPIQSHRKFIGKMLIFFRKIGKWLITPALAKQTQVNQSSFLSLLVLSKKIEELENKISELSEQLNKKD